MLEVQIAQEEQQEKSRLSELKLSLSTYQLTCNLAKNELDYQKASLLQAREDYKKDKDNLVLLAAKKTYRDAEEKYKSALEQCDYVEKEIADYQVSENSNIKILKHKIKLSELTIKQLQEKKQIIEKMQYADKSGIVAELCISKGIYTTACQKIYTLYDTKKLNLKIKTEEKNFGLLSEGDTVTLKDDHTNFSLVIKEKQATNQNKIGDVVLNDTFYLIASLDKEQKKKFIIGDARQYKMEFFSSKKALLCSYSSLIREEENYFIFICDLDTQKISKQKVEIGNLQEDKIEITGDISEQDYIVKNPEESYYDGEVFASVVKE
ncbi:MAG: efflux RND transporter periplasmic adaptor subunit [Lachnospiraceae bacterium]|nr:efflux RND transporter periplasmic adaptor subunit [Lachnospiraceae bacterium]